MRYAKLLYSLLQKESIKLKISNTVEKVVLELNDQMPDEAVLLKEANVGAAEGDQVQQGFVVLKLHHAAHCPSHLLG